MSIKPEQLAERMQRYPFCDVTGVQITQDAKFNFNGYDLLSEKCYCHAFVLLLSLYTLQSYPP
jgi:hypothetical protein